MRQQYTCCVLCCVLTTLSGISEVCEEIIKQQKSEKTWFKGLSVSTGALSQPFSPASGDGVCPGSDIEFTCVVDTRPGSTTRWEITPDGGEPACTVALNFPNETQRCGRERVFTSSLIGQTGLNYTSSLRAEDVSLSLDGTLVECVDGTDLQIIGSAIICIAGKGDFIVCYGVMHLPLTSKCTYKGFCLV